MIKLQNQLGPVLYQFISRQKIYMHLKNMNLTNSAYMDLILPLKTLSQTDGHRPLESPSQISDSSLKHFD